MKISHIVRLEKNTIAYRLAEESLIKVKDHGDFSTFSDKGDITLIVLYRELLAAYKPEITKETRQRLGIPEKKRRRKR